MTTQTVSLNRMAACRGSSPVFRFAGGLRRRRSVSGRTASPGIAARRLREGQHSPQAAPTALLRPQLLFHSTFMGDHLRWHATRLKA
jgi:hypothetical protein